MTSTTSDALPSPPAARPVLPGTPHWTPAIHPQRGHARHLREKLAVLAAFPEDALVAEPGFEAMPALQQLARLAASEHPQAMAVDGLQWRADWLGWALDAQARPIDLHGGWPEIGGHLSALPPVWRHAALLALAFAEDFALVDDNDASPCLRWGVLALPSHWAPEAALGAALAPVPLPGHEHIVEQPSPSPRLHMHPRRADTLVAGGIEAARRWLRREHRRTLPLAGLPYRALLLRIDTQPMHGLPPPASS